MSNFSRRKEESNKNCQIIEAEKSHIHGHLAQSVKVQVLNETERCPILCFGPLSIIIIPWNYQNFMELQPETF